MYVTIYNLYAPNLVIELVAIIMLVRWAFRTIACSWVLLFRSFGAFQWPRVLCGRLTACCVIGMGLPVEESFKVIADVVDLLGVGVPSGLKVKDK